MYRERNVCGRFRSQSKEHRCVATRYENEATNFLAFVGVAGIMVALK